MAGLLRIDVLIFLSLQPSWGSVNFPLAPVYIGVNSHNHQVNSVAFSSDRKTLATGSYDGIIKLWDMQTRTCLYTLRSERPYERMNITQAKGLTEIQKATLRSLGAIENE